MMQFDVVPEPAEFRAQVSVPGARWLENHPDGGRPPDYWSSFQSHLAAGFNDLCGYLAMYVTDGTVDHFVSVREDRSRTYDWSNYRFASAWMNSVKGSVSSTDILDPYAVEDGWFEILLPSLQLVVTDAVPERLRTRAEFVLDRLRLRDDARVLRQRAEWYRMYVERQMTLAELARKAPLIARAVRASQQPP